MVSSVVNHRPSRRRLEWRNVCHQAGQSRLLENIETGDDAWSNDFQYHEPPESPRHSTPDEWFHRVTGY